MTVAMATCDFQSAEIKLLQLRKVLADVLHGVKGELLAEANIKLLERQLVEGAWQCCEAIRKVTN